MVTFYYDCIHSITCVHVVLCVLHPIMSPPSTLLPHSPASANSSEQRALIAASVVSSERGQQRAGHSAASSERSKCAAHPSCQAYAPYALSLRCLALPHTARLECACIWFKQDFAMVQASLTKNSNSHYSLSAKFKKNQQKTSNLKHFIK